MRSFTHTVSGKTGASGIQLTRQWTSVPRWQATLPSYRAIPKSHNSNPHSATVYPNCVAASRGFLPRGLSDACPLSPCVHWQACGWGQAS